jgi:uncharacterized membrane protein
MTDPISDFIYEYFLKTMCYQYNVVNTVVYGLILAAAVFGTYKLLEKLKIKIDKKLFCAIMPFIIFGGSARALRDHTEISTIFQSVPQLFCSPIIYFVIFAIALGSLLLGIALQKKFKIGYWKVMCSVGLLILVYNIINFRIENWAAVAMIGGLFAFWIALFFGFSHFRPKIFSRMNAGILSSHFMDASSTFVALTFFGYVEQHVLPSFLIDLAGGPAAGAWIMFPMKILVVGGVLLLLDKYSEDEQFKNFLKLIILILGLALGTRDFLTVSMMQV